MLIWNALITTNCTFDIRDFSSIFLKKKIHFKNAQKGFKLRRNPGVQLVRDRRVYALHIQNITLKILLQKNLKKGAVNGPDEFTSSKKKLKAQKQKKTVWKLDGAAAIKKHCSSTPPGGDKEHHRSLCDLQHELIDGWGVYMDSPSDSLSSSRESGRYRSWNVRKKKNKTDVGSVPNAFSVNK